MIRKLLRVAAVATVLHVFAPAVCSAQDVALALDGVYRSEGVNPDGTKYRGTVEIAKDDQTYLVRWLARQVTSIGIGIVRGDVLAVSYYTGTNIGIALYHIEKGPRLTGEWTVLGADGQRYPETLTKMGRDAREQDPDGLPEAAPREVVVAESR
jgi:hypothetical protein